MRARTTLALALLCAASSVAARGIAPLVDELMGTRVVRAGNLRTEQTAGGSVQRYFDAPTSTLLRLGLRARTVAPGATPNPVLPYTVPQEQILLVKEGVLEVKLDEKKPAERLEAGSAVFLQPHQWHSIRNPGTQPAVFYEIDWTSPGMNGEKQF